MSDRKSLDTLCAALAYAMKVDAPECANEANPTLVKYIDEKFGEKPVDRIFMYNPDADGEWVYQTYSHLLKETTDHTAIGVSKSERFIKSDHSNSV